MEPAPTSRMEYFYLAPDAGEEDFPLSDPVPDVLLEVPESDFFDSDALSLFSAGAELEAPSFLA